MSTPAPSDAVDPKPALAETALSQPVAGPSDDHESAQVVDVSEMTDDTRSAPATIVSHAQSDAPASWLWINKYDQLFVGVFAAVFLALSGYHWATLGGLGMRPIELDRLPARQYDFRVDINTASWVEWTQIEGIGEATAQKIIAERKANGPFRSVKDLLRVKGIGPKSLEKMRPFLREPNEKAAP